MSDTSHDQWVKDTLGVDPGAYQAAAAPPSASAPASAPGGGGGFRGFLSSIGNGLASMGKAVAGAVKGAIDGISKLIFGPPPPVIGTAQKKRSDDMLAKLSNEDQDKFLALQRDAKSDKEKQYLEKGLAAGHSVTELQAFAQKIAGKDEKWLQDNLSLTGNSEGKGVKQQWHMACNATTVQAIRGELDPLYALKMHEDNPNLTEADGDDPNTLNPNLAADQKSLLESPDDQGDAGGVALPRDHDNVQSGRWNTDLLNNIKDVTGLSFTNKKIGGDITEEEGIKEIDAHLDEGTPVPIVIGNASDQYTHYVLVTKSDKGPPRTYMIHDPWEGKTYKRSAEQLSKGTLDIAGSNQISAIEMPSVDPVP